MRVSIIVSGQKVELPVSKDQKIGRLCKEALAKVGFPTDEDWEMRDSDGKLLEHDVRIYAYQIKGGQTLYLSPKAGVGA